MIVNPSDVPGKDKERRTKTDTIDSIKLAKSLRSGELEGIYIPDAEAISLRSLVRLRTGFVRKQTRCKNQIKSFLNYLGIELSEDKAQSYWSGAYIERLKNLELPEEKNKTGRSNLYLRNMLIECSWVSIRKDPALAASFKEYIKRMHRNKAIIKICRKLINRIYYVLKTQKKYETGIVR